MTRENLRVLLVDDHMMVRAGLAQLIGSQPGFEIAGEAASGEGALALCKTCRPDIVIMDMRMRGMGGIAATEAICRRHPEIRVVGLSTFYDRRSIDLALAAGVRGFLPKTILPPALLDALRRVYDGERVIVEESAAAVPEAAAHQPAGDSPALSVQQRRVLALLTKGCTNADISAVLGIAVPTARYHVSALLVKLGVSNRAEAAAMAVRDQLVGQDDF